MTDITLAGYFISTAHHFILIIKQVGGKAYDACSPSDASLCLVWLQGPGCNNYTI
jgi:hypothetical protein